MKDKIIKFYNLLKMDKIIPLVCGGALLKMCSMYSNGGSLHEKEMIDYGLIFSAMYPLQYIIRHISKNEKEVDVVGR